MVLFNPESTEPQPTPIGADSLFLLGLTTCLLFSASGFRFVRIAVRLRVTRLWHTEGQVSRPLASCLLCCVNLVQRMEYSVLRSVCWIPQGPVQGDEHMVQTRGRGSGRDLGQRQRMHVISLSAYFCGPMVVRLAIYSRLRVGMIANQRDTTNIAHIFRLVPTRMSPLPTSAQTSASSNKRVRTLLNHLDSSDALGLTRHLWP